jgi:hypothetical protein
VNCLAKILAYQAEPAHLAEILSEFLQGRVEGWIVSRAALKRLHNARNSRHLLIVMDLTSTNPAAEGRWRTPDGCRSRRMIANFWIAWKSGSNRTSLPRIFGPSAREACRLDCWMSRCRIVGAGTKLPFAVQRCGVR